MKLVWSPEMASTAFIHTVKFSKILDGSSAAEFMSAMAAGWNAQLVVETWRRGGSTAASVGLAVATQQSGGRHVCVVSDEETKAEYVEAMRETGHAADVVVSGRPEVAMEGLDGIDFLVVDCRRNDFDRILTAARFGQKGAVVVCKNASSAGDLRWRYQGRLRVVHSAFLPVGNGLQIDHVGAVEDGGGPASDKGRSRWIKNIDRRSGEEMVFRR